MIRKTAVLTRVGGIPAVVGFCLMGSIAVRAQDPPPANAPAAKPAATESHSGKPAEAAAKAPVAEPSKAVVADPAKPADTAGKKVDDPSTKAAATTPPAAAGSSAATAPAADQKPAQSIAKADTPATTAAPAAAISSVAVPADAAKADAAKPATTGEAPKNTAALPDPAASTPAAPEQVLPPADPIVAGIRQKLPELAKKTNADEAAALGAFYGELNGAAIWASTSGLTPKGKAVVEEIGRADNWGLPASAFDVPAASTATLTPEAAADTEIKVALAVLKYARYARGGRVNPASISQLMDQSPTLVAPKTVLTEIAAAEKPDAYLLSLHPKHEQFDLLRQALLKLRGGDVKEEQPSEDPALSVKLPPGGVIRPGGQDPQIALLRQRLKVSADDATKENVYDDKLQAAVRAFQTSKGLRPDGVIGNNTRSVLNGGPKPEPVTADSKIERILINMERWRWMPANLGPLYVWDNVPEFLTRVVKNDKIIHTDAIIVGQPSWPTPIFSADMKTVVFHPSWGVPDGIKQKELAPLLRKSSGGDFFGIFGGGYSAQAVLEAYQLRAYQNGRMVDANSVNWSSVDIRSFSFQQPPGPKNVLGDVKFMFPNSHDVYMHDTPERNLFGKSFRALSHGCMRVEEPRRLAEILLGEDKGWAPERVRGMFNGNQSDVPLDRHIPVHVTYFTARVDDNGKLQTYGDFYGLDSRTAAALTGKAVRFEQPAYADDVVASGDPYDTGAPTQQQARRGKKKQYQGPASLSDAISGLFSP